MTPTGKDGGGFVLTLNAGSSSLKFAAFELGEEPLERVRGSIDGAADQRHWLDLALDHAAAEIGRPTWAGIGHRIVHGGPRLSAPQLLDAKLVAQLQQLLPFAPEHLPKEIALIDQAGRRFPGVPQAACFDTAFHHTLPRVAQLLPIPRRYEAAGVRRYGFHGLSYEFLLRELGLLGDPAAATGRVILAHLGNGASLAAIRDGACIDTSMAFTPAAGLVMSSRAGDLDPGLLAYLAQAEGMSAAALGKLVNHQSGLLGISETSSDLRELLSREAHDVRAAEAIAHFCQQVKKWVGAYAAVLGGLDTLVLSGGIGEHQAPIRGRICAGLGFLGIELDDSLNAVHAPVISSSASRVTVRVIRTNEELVIARALSRLLQLHGTHQ